MIAHGRARRGTRSTVAPALAGALSLLASTALASCVAREPSSPDAVPTPTAETIGTASPTSPSPSGADTGVPRLRFDDNGSHLALRVDRTAVIFLPAASWFWTDPAVDGTAVTVSEDISDAESTSRSWTVTARESGTATISTTGSPTRRSATPPCDSPDLRWEVRVTVG